MHIKRVGARARLPRAPLAVRRRAAAVRACRAAAAAHVRARTRRRRPPSPPPMPRCAHAAASAQVGRRASHGGAVVIRRGCHAREDVDTALATNASRGSATTSTHARAPPRRSSAAGETQA
eukprot:6203125-Pleurochrysis_carterae.AAC.3